MKTITLAQREALDVVKDMIDKSNPDVPEFGTKVMTLILGILNVDCRVEHVAPTLADNPDNTLPIDYDGLREGNERINIPDWMKSMPTPPFVPGDRTSEPAPWEPRIWYNQEPAPYQTDKAEIVRYATSVSCTEDKNCITTTRDVSDCTTYTGDFRDVQTSFNDK